MSVSTSRLDGHERYLHGLDRALRVAIVASLAVHLAFLSLLPSPFHHPHPALRTLEVDLVEAPVPLPELPQPPAVESPAALPVVPAARPKPEPTRMHKPVAEPKPVRERTTVVPAPTASPERLLTHADPDKAVTSIPVPQEAPANQEKAAANPPASTKEAGADSGPQTPPSFRAGYLRNPEPPYPTTSRRLGEEGTVQLRVVVSAEGQPVSVDVHRSSGHPRLDEAAAAAVRAWRFVPARRGDTPIEAAVIVPIVFRLESE
jgi:protein TonB